MPTPSIIWRRLDHPGHEFARLERQPHAWQLTGTAVIWYEQLACWLAYEITCAPSWETQAARVTGWVGERSVDLTIRVDAARRWFLNETEYPAVTGCVDIDFGFSPLTNLLPIRRTNLAIGRRADVAAAWLIFPELTLQRLDQTYYRFSERTYRYESAGGRFTRELTVNANGLVTHYPGLWQAEPVG